MADAFCSGVRRSSAINYGPGDIGIFVAGVACNRNVVLTSSPESVEVWRAEREERIEMYPLELKIRLCPSKHTFVLGVIIIMVGFLHHGPRI